ncbi:hypothetical protein EP7_002478 [Isosphaeraceae bacterium EP7]
MTLITMGAAPEAIKLTVSPSPAPVPALAFRLLPIESELTPGNAAPIYLRLSCELWPEGKKDLDEKLPAWAGLPPNLFPAAEARKFIDSWQQRLDQLAYGARRETCDWNYTLPEERANAMDILLPDAQEMRTWARLLSLKARVEILEGKPIDAVRTVETGLALARHVARGPFVINAIVGISYSTSALAQVDNLVAIPGAPNLYWSLTALPRPLIGIRRGVEHDAKMAEWMLGLNDLHQPRTDVEWSERLDRLHARLTSLKGSLKPEGLDPRMETPAGFRTVALPRAREVLKTAGIPAEGLADDRLILMAYAAAYQKFKDDYIKSSYLPFDQAGPFYKQDRLFEEKSGPFWFIYSSMTTSIRSAHEFDAKLDRKVAALRVVEALRLQAGRSGRLPGSLDEVTVVPIPTDPYSGKAFAYQLDGDTATLSGHVPNGQEASGLIYQITLRK